MVQKKRSKAKKRRVVKRQISTIDLIELLGNAIVERWPDDSTTPGIVISPIPSRHPFHGDALLDGVAPKRVWYVSVTRYNQPNGMQGRVSVYNSQQDKLVDAVHDVIRLFSRHPTKAQRQLTNAAKDLPNVSEDVSAT